MECLLLFFALIAEGRTVATRAEEDADVLALATLVPLLFHRRTDTVCRDRDTARQTYVSRRRTRDTAPYTYVSRCTFISSIDK